MLTELILDKAKYLIFVYIFFNFVYNCRYINLIKFLYPVPGLVFIYNTTFLKINIKTYIIENWKHLLP